MGGGANLSSTRRPATDVGEHSEEREAGARGPVFAATPAAAAPAAAAGGAAEVYVASAPPPPSSGNACGWALLAAGLKHDVDAPVQR